MYRSFVRPSISTTRDVRFYLRRYFGIDDNQYIIEIELGIIVIKHHRQTRRKFQRMLKTAPWPMGVSVKMKTVSHEALSSHYRNLDKCVESVK